MRLIMTKNIPPLKNTKNMKIHEKYMKTHCPERFTQDMKNHHQTLEIHVKTDFGSLYLKAKNS